ncbi:DUF11 domain-containing protein [Candidatus Thorarchaeota archaeon]|nr:MAG: DUF11 domain-containing protein [Candidatus Thorarchaeota archaeon]
MSENTKKNVTIDLEESEKTRLGGTSELESIEVAGKLSVKNVSERSRIWNVKVHLGDSRDSTDIATESLSGGEVDVGGTWESKYGVTVEAPIVTLSEVYDTCGTVETEEPHWAYVASKDNPVKITITIKNETDGEIDSIILNKTIPPELSNIRIISSKSGTAEFDEGTRQVVWKGFVVYPHEETNLVIGATGQVHDKEPKSAGEIVLTYKGEGQQRSVLDPDLTALTEFLMGIETAETEPNQWECTLECSNESDMIVRLDKAEVYLTPEGGGEKQKMIDAAPSIELSPNQEWSASFEVASKETPKCTQEILYTPVRVITKRVLGTIEKTPQIIPVYKIDYIKEFDPPAVNSFDKTPVEVTIEVTNAGTAKLNEVFVEDNLPDDIMPPTSEHITVWIRGEEYTGEYEFVIDPEDQNPEKPHKITFRIENLRDSIGELEPGESVKINYAVMAWRNRPEKEYPSPIACTANTYPAGIPAEVASPEDGHKLGVIYKKRAISTKKAINKGADAGEYEVVLVVSNNGEVTAENIEMTDWIPSGFEYIGTDPEDDQPDVVGIADGTNMVWKWARMNPGDKKKMRVTVQGEGEYERREPQVTSI